jgi:hypothetical protein
VTKDVSKFQNLTIDSSQLNEELERQSSSYVFVGQAYNEAEGEYEAYKLRVKQLVAALDEQIRIKAVNGKKKITEAAITKEIERHPDYIKAMEHQIKLNRRKEDLKILTWGWRDRNELLLERSRSARDEMKQIANNVVKSELKAVNG